MEYPVEIVTEPFSWSQIPQLMVQEYSWGGTYRPKVTAQMVFVKGKGFIIHMECDETHPLATFTENNTPVCQDSCMECFINCNPALGNGYINFETNANGALYNAFGPDRHHRQYLRDLGLEEPKVIICQNENGWSCEYTLSLDTVQALFHRDDFAEGDILKANFYKCGDKTEVAHYASWQPINRPAPDFHQPDFFGTLRITKSGII